MAVLAAATVLAADVLLEALVLVGLALFETSVVLDVAVWVAGSGRRYARRRSRPVRCR
jgi:hypothetical protein